jgi:hypothetical protein
VTISKPVARLLAPLLAVMVALGAFAAASISTVSTAEAATGKVKLKTKGPYKKNQKLTVKVSGFPANAAVAVGVCPAKIAVPKGVGDCGAPKLNYSQLTTTNAKGKVTVTLNVPKGKLGASNWPKAKCNKKKKCRVYVSTISVPSPTNGKSPVLKY